MCDEATIFTQQSISSDELLTDLASDTFWINVNVKIVNARLLIKKRYEPLLNVLLTNECGRSTIPPRVSDSSDLSLSINYQESIIRSIVEWWSSSERNVLTFESSMRCTPIFSNDGLIGEASGDRVKMLSSGSVGESIVRWNARVVVLILRRNGILSCALRSWQESHISDVLWLTMKGWTNLIRIPIIPQPNMIEQSDCWRTIRWLFLKAQDQEVEHLCWASWWNRRVTVVDNTIHSRHWIEIRVRWPSVE